MPFFEGLRSYIHTKRVENAERALCERKAAYQENDARSARIRERVEQAEAEKLKTVGKDDIVYDPDGNPHIRYIGQSYVRSSDGKDVHFYELAPEVQEKWTAQDRAMAEAQQKANQEHREAELNRLRRRLNRIKERR